MKKVIPSAQLIEMLQQQRRHAELHAGISHRSYLRNDGGIEHCVRRESAIAALANVDYLHLCSPRAEVYNNEFPPLVEVCLNDEWIGLTSLDGFSAKAGLLKPGMVFLHSALGFESNSLIRLLLSFKPYGAILQWHHDLAFACASVTLVRNGVACGVPGLDSGQCDGCSFNGTRTAVMAHYDLIEQLADCQVFPSVAAQSRYNLSIAARGRVIPPRQAVLPHYVVQCSHSSLESRRPTFGDDPVGIAFFGHSVQHKGWSEYLQLVSALHTNPAYRFYHIGLAGQVDPRIERLDFSEAFGAVGTDGLRELCARRNIRLAFFWPVALESFGIMLRQVLGAGCAVLCADNNDAQKEFINDCRQLRYFDRLEEVITWFGDQEQVIALLHQAAQSNCVLTASNFSYDLINLHTGRWQMAI